MNSHIVAIGLRAKTGRAIAVIVGGSPHDPVIVAKTEIKLIDPKLPATAQPYHEVMNLPWEETQRKVQKSVRAIQKVAALTLAELIKQHIGNDMQLRAVATVGAKDRELARIGNPHIRAHAAEGILFRRVLDEAACAKGLSFRTFPDREFADIVKRELGPYATSMKKRLDDAARALPPPWRTDEKIAAAAAWLVLHNVRA